jgi:hypothetical protein
MIFSKNAGEPLGKCMSVVWGKSEWRERHFIDNVSVNPST